MGLRIDLFSSVSSSKFRRLHKFLWRRDGAVGIAACYGLDGPGIESRWGARFSAPIQIVPGAPPSLLYNECRVFPGGKAAGSWR
jgi:anaerobic glycerol-3-phosphate dehydrogenase